jgi:hypothetical protein
MQAKHPVSDRINALRADETLVGIDLAVAAIDINSVLMGHISEKFDNKGLTQQSAAKQALVLVSYLLHPQSTRVPLLKALAICLNASDDKARQAFYVADGMLQFHWQQEEYPPICSHCGIRPVNATGSQFCEVCATR